MALKNKVFLTLLTVSLLAVFAFFVWNNMKAFVGDSTKNPNSYVLEFEVMNREDTYVIPACQDDVFVVNFRIDKGHADLIIAMDAVGALRRSILRSKTAAMRSERPGRNVFS